MTAKTSVGWFLDFVRTFVITSTSSFVKISRIKEPLVIGGFMKKFKKTGRICERTSKDPTIQGRLFDQFFGL
jgi:hypothetical protein